jgi:hypothetical protein
MPSTIQKIKAAVQNGTLPSAFTPADINKKLNIDWAGTFLPKHRVRNPGGNRIISPSWTSRNQAREVSFEIVIFKMGQCLNAE